MSVTPQTVLRNGDYVPLSEFCAVMIKLTQLDELSLFELWDRCKDKNHSFYLCPDDVPQILRIKKLIIEEEKDEVPEVVKTIVCNACKQSGVSVELRPLAQIYKTLRHIKD